MDALHILAGAYLLLPPALLQVVGLSEPPLVSVSPITEPIPIHIKSEDSWLDGQVSLVGGEVTSSKEQYEFAQGKRLLFAHTEHSYQSYVTDGYFVKLKGPNLQVLAQRPYVLPTTADFVLTLSEKYAAANCGQLIITGAGRLTSERPRNGSIHSVHPAGMAVDIRVLGIGERCEAWLSQYLADHESKKVIDATREYYPPHYHVVVVPPQNIFLGDQQKMANLTADQD